ncbi:Uncharacterized protein Fot_05693 [Forsythia ovata]|uniref:Uncharacterized protein n=1 Tax=Forsythia ovata TaxID=205694 RepID=A0ABD1WQU7_9LAMI
MVRAHCRIDERSPIWRRALSKLPIPAAAAAEGTAELPPLIRTMTSPENPRHYQSNSAASGSGYVVKTSSFSTGIYEGEQDTRVVSLLGVLMDSHKSSPMTTSHFVVAASTHGHMCYHHHCFITIHIHNLLHHNETKKTPYGHD